MSQLQLIHSMKAFLFFEACAPSDLDISISINQIRVTNDKPLDTFYIGIALNKWQIHHGYKLMAQKWLDKSIKELVEEAVKIDGNEIEAFVEKRMVEIAKLYSDHITQSNKEHAIYEKEEYLMNLN